MQGLTAESKNNNIRYDVYQIIAEFEKLCGELRSSEKEERRATQEARSHRVNDIVANMHSQGRWTLALGVATGIFTLSAGASKALSGENMGRAVNKIPFFGGRAVRYVTGTDLKTILAGKGSVNPADLKNLRALEKMPEVVSTFFSSGSQFSQTGGSYLTTVSDAERQKIQSDVERLKQQSENATQAVQDLESSHQTARRMTEDLMRSERELGGIVAR